VPCRAIRSIFSTTVSSTIFYFPSPKSPPPDLSLVQSVCRKSGPGVGGDVLRPAEAWPLPHFSPTSPSARRPWGRRHPAWVSTNPFTSTDVVQVTLPILALCFWPSPGSWGFFPFFRSLFTSYPSMSFRSNVEGTRLFPDKSRCHFPKFDPKSSPMVHARVFLFSCSWILYF